MSKTLTEIQKRASKLRKDVIQEIVKVVKKKGTFKNGTYQLDLCEIGATVYNYVDNYVVQLLSLNEDSITTFCLLCSVTPITDSSLKGNNVIESDISDLQTDSLITLLGRIS